MKVNQNQSMGEQVRFDLNSEFEDRNYKSCFARSVAVNSQYRQTKSLDFKQLQKEDNNGEEGPNQTCFNNRPFHLEPQEVVRLRKNCCSKVDAIRRFSCSNINSTRSSICSSRITEIPVENLVNQSKIETLQWQLREIQKSREMYRAVMKQVVNFLEKAHHSLELLGNRINRKNSVPRSRSEHQIAVDNSSATLNSGFNRTLEDYATFARRQNREDDPSPEEIPPEKLAQEAFRLLRTAQSLLNTREPDLVQLENQPENDIEFLAQLVKEFPSIPEHKPQRTTSFSLSPKLIVPEMDVKISTAFNRKLSLQLSEVRKCSKTFKTVDSARGSVAESDMELVNENGVFGNQTAKSEKSNSPATGSISSVEDESGFSSLNSFQEVGLPLVNSTMTEKVCTKSALLRSMLHNNSDYSSLNYFPEPNSVLENTMLSSNNQYKREPEQKRNVDEVKLWQKPSFSLCPQHKRWYSATEDGESQSMKVLWV